MSSGREGKEEVMMQMFINGPMSNAKVQSSNEADSKRNFDIRAFGIDLTFGF